MHLVGGGWEVDTFNRSRLQPQAFWMDDKEAVLGLSWGHEGSDPVWRIERSCEPTGVLARFVTWAEDAIQRRRDRRWARRYPIPAGGGGDERSADGD